MNVAAGLTAHFTVSLMVLADLTFGRGTAQFKTLVTYLALVSVILWGLVVLSMIFRWISRLLLRPQAITKPPLHEELPR